MYTLTKPSYFISTTIKFIRSTDLREFNVILNVIRVNVQYNLCNTKKKHYKENGSQDEVI